MRKALMSATAVIALATVVAASANAGEVEANCSSATGQQWLPREAIGTIVTDLGYRVERIEVKRGCYEATAMNDSGIPIIAIYHPVKGELVNASLAEHEPVANTAAVRTHSHEDAGAASPGLQLDDGKKWPTDLTLREGMAGMHSALSASLPSIHAGTFSTAEYASLAERIQAQVDYVVANCRLPEQADLQLHVVLTQILEGIGAMAGPDTDRASGATTVIQALNAYGAGFNHPDWVPLSHH